MSAGTTLNVEKSGIQANAGRRPVRRKSKAYRSWCVTGITGIDLTDGAIQVAWRSQIGETCQLQYSDTLGTTHWSHAAPDVTATGATFTQTNAIGGAFQHFYRVYPAGL